MVLAHPRLIFGTSTIGEDQTTLEAVTDLLEVLKLLGINEVDTAGLYPPTNMGASERLLGEVGAAAKGFAIDTKILILSPEANGTLQPVKIEESVATSHERLQLHGQRLNVLHCHAPDFTTPLKDQAATLNSLHKRGLFDKLGVCNWPSDLLTDFIDICEREGYVKPTVYQGLYNVVYRGHEKLFPTLRKHGIAFNAHSPLAGGFLTGRLTAGDVEGTRFAKGNIIGTSSKAQYDKPELHDTINSLSKALEPVNMSKIEASLRWISYHSQLGPEDGIILGASKPHYLVENVKAIQKGPLPKEIVSAVESVWDTLSGGQ